jgi:hypothetical protein
MAGFTYGGNFEQTIDELYSPKNIAETARKFAEYEKQHGPHSFGQNYTKFLVPKPESGRTIPDRPMDTANGRRIPPRYPRRSVNRITGVISANLRSDKPLPMVLKVGENVDASHDLHVRTFAHKSQVHIGLHMLCRNTSLK